ncbi:UNVERIFIED_CONTAM: Tubulin-tyrosine ligase family protein [Hammondia hammondi]|eukprot:XP_008885757.1 Tubulin-tyrosine ligase family protein [Hammondia hammondi]
MRPYQKINHFVGTNAISRKNYLARNLLRMKAYYPQEYKFFPHTWSLPADLADFRCQFTGRRRKTYIIKPDASSQGRGIFLTRNIEDINPTEHLVAQRYLHKPFLIDGLKFDLRIYVLLAGCNPLRLFVHQDGLVRFATSPYAKPTGKNLRDKTMHLTNYAINKSSSNFTPNKDPANPSKGHKRSLFHVLDHLKNEGHDVDALLKEIDECLCKTIIAIQPSLAHIYGSCKGEDLSNSMCFEILGIDIMIDHKLTPWLIEVNHSPSFTTDSELDTIVKFKVIRDALVLLGLSSENRRNYHAQQRLQAEQRRTSFPKQTREERLQSRRQMMNELAKSRTAWEDAHMGGWRRIFPTEERATKYGHLFEAADEIWQSMTGMCKTKPILMQLQEARRFRILDGMDTDTTRPGENLNRACSSSASAASTAASRSKCNLQKGAVRATQSKSTIRRNTSSGNQIVSRFRLSERPTNESPRQAVGRNPLSRRSVSLSNSLERASAAASVNDRPLTGQCRTNSSEHSQKPGLHQSTVGLSAGWSSTQRPVADESESVRGINGIGDAGTFFPLESLPQLEETTQHQDVERLVKGELPFRKYSASAQPSTEEEGAAKCVGEAKARTIRATVAQAPTLLTANRKRVKKTTCSGNSSSNVSSSFHFPWSSPAGCPESLLSYSGQATKQRSVLTLVRIGDVSFTAEGLRRQQHTPKGQRQHASGIT